jgi:hypothetical protein
VDLKQRPAYEQGLRLAQPAPLATLRGSPYSRHEKFFSSSVLPDPV